MSRTYLLVGILCLAMSQALGQSVMEGSYNVTAACTTVKVGTKLGSIVSCSTYYLCTNTGPSLATCTDGYSFSNSRQSCAPATQVNCYLGLANPCTGRTGSSWVPVTGTCNQWTYCNNDMPGGTGSCALNEYFDPTAQQCKYGSCQNSDSGDGDGLVNMCQVMPPNVYFGSISNCQAWNYCNSDGSMSSGLCTTSAFVVSLGECGYNSNGACDRIVQNATPTTCTTQGTVIADPNTCGNYLTCNGHTYVASSCPYGYYYDTTSSSCMTRQTASPSPTCNRCQYATSQFVNAVDHTDCNAYYYCNNGSNGPVSTCPLNYYFNESDQACANDGGIIPYALLNGACSGAVAPTTVAPTTKAPTTIAVANPPNGK